MDQKCWSSEVTLLEFSMYRVKTAVSQIDIFESFKNIGIHCEVSINLQFDFL